MLIKIARKLIGILPDAGAFHLARLLAERPGSPALKPRDKDVLREATPFRVAADTGYIQAWSWGQGPVVVLVHGWGGRGVQLAMLAQRLAASGYRTVIYDARGHGDSSGSAATFASLYEDVIAVAAALNEPVHAFVGHSAGGLCMMAARHHGRISAPVYVCLSAPVSPYVPVNEIRRLLSPPPAVVVRFDQYYATQLGGGAEHLRDAEIFSRPGTDRLLLVYDRQDDRVSWLDGEVIQRRWPSARVLVNSGLGHMKVLWDPEIIQSVTDFVLHAAHLEDAAEPEGCECNELTGTCIQTDC
jgi:pimeloyl-ACP methyl ester carboxylesterase